MTAAAGITTSAQPPTAVVNIQPGMNVQPVVLVDQNGQYVTPGGTATTAGSLATTTTPVNVAAAAAPSTGQVLTATSGTTATWQNGVNAILTTLGDIIAENSVPTAVRVAGNTTATKNFLTQTGTGSASALPAWGTIASADMPTGTTGAKGALQLDGTASDIANTGTQAAGAIGKAADAGHVHFSSGMYLCAPTSYAPTTQTILATSSSTMAAVTGAASTVAAGSNGGTIANVASWSSPSAGVLAVASGVPFPTQGGTVNVAASGPTTAVVTYTGVSGNTLTGCAYVSGSPSGTVSTGGAVTLTSAVASTGSFTAPASGKVMATIAMVADNNSGSSYFGLAAHGTVTPMVSNVWVWADTGAQRPRVLKFLVTGLTPGNSYNFDLLFACSAGTTQVLAFGQSTTTPSSSAGAPLTMEVQAV